MNLPNGGGAASRGPGGGLPLLPAYWCTCSTGVLQHFGGVAACGLGDPEAPEHARDLAHALLGIERLDGGEGPARAGLLAHAKPLACVHGPPPAAPAPPHLLPPPQHPPPPPPTPR